jgi:putative transposase
VAAVTQRGISIEEPCRTFGVSETCYRYKAKLDDENERISGLLLGLEQTRRGITASDQGR